MDTNGDEETLDLLLTDWHSFQSNSVNFENTLKGMIRKYENIRNENNGLKREIRDHITEKEALNEENKALNFENTCLKADKDMFMSEIKELRTENDSLSKHLHKSRTIESNAKQLLANLLTDQSNNGLLPVVSSTPCFSEQMILKERPNSLTNFDSICAMTEMRLTHSDSVDKSKSGKMMSNQNSTETNTSEGTFYDVPSHHSSANTSSISVRPKVCQQNVVSSTVDLNDKTVKQCENANESQVTGSVSSKTFTFDERTNLKLKLVKVPIGRLIPVYIAFIESPSSFWLHLDANDVTDYIHVIQVKQKDLMSTSDYRFTLDDITIGMYCAAIYPSDSFWYRAQVIDIINHKSDDKDSVRIVVSYIDWGNTEALPLSQVMKLSHDLTKRKQAIHCYLQGFNLEFQKWSDKAVEMFNQVVKDKNLKGMFNRGHKISETLESYTYPVDLIINFDGNKTENLANFLPIPEMITMDEPQNRIDINSVPTGQHNQMDSRLTQSTVERANQSPKSLPMQKCVKDIRSANVSRSVNDFNKCNGFIRNNTNLTQSLSQTLNHCSSQSSLKSNNKILVIPPPIVPDNSDGLIVLISHIISPSEFYIHINDPQTGIAQLEDLEEHLFNYYSTYDSRHEIESSQVTIGSFWSCQYSEDLRWYRTRVLDIYEGIKALVSYVDYGNTEMVDIKDLKPLIRQFSTCPALAVKCQLSRVDPIDDKEWSKDSIKYFNELTGFNQENILTAYIGQKPLNISFESQLEILLWANDQNETNSREILINSKLVVDNFAKTDDMSWVKEAEREGRENTPPEVKQLIEIAYGRAQLNGTVASVSLPTRCVPELFDNEYDDEFDPMEADAYCLENNYSTLPNDPSTVTLGYHSEDKRTCKFYRTRKGCNLNTYCPFLHQNPEKIYADEEEENLMADELELEIGSSVLMKITGVHSPFSFYGILPFGTTAKTEQQFREVANSVQNNQFKPFAELSNSLKSYYSKLRTTENLNVYHAIGTLVAFIDEHKVYNRGRVIGNNPDSNTCSLFNVDLGYNIDIERKSIFKLPFQFTQFPILAVQCSIDCIKPSGGQWTEEARTDFANWTLNNYFCAQIQKERFENKFSIELIDYSGDEKTFISDKLIDHNHALPVAEEAYCSDLD